MERRDRRYQQQKAIGICPQWPGHFPAADAEHDSEMSRMFEREPDVGNAKLEDLCSGGYALLISVSQSCVEKDKALLLDAPKQRLLVGKMTIRSSRADPGDSDCIL